ncbi:hypothetical protein GQ600_14536 [Phytophthora cactorum]|nr:hypothetical protein GQ600_14536 [Phytophthora cactorum]
MSWTLLDSSPATSTLSCSAAARTAVGVATAASSTLVRRGRDKRRDTLCLGVSSFIAAGSRASNVNNTVPVASYLCWSNVWTRTTTRPCCGPLRRWHPTRVAHRCQRPAAQNAPRQENKRNKKTSGRRSPRTAPSCANSRASRPVWRR